MKFVKETKVDALAIAMGTSHGAYKFTRKPDGDILAMNVIEEIHRKLPNTHLVMHGSSSVPQDLQDIINANGGKMKPTWGVPVAEIQRGIKHGVRKINIDTDNRMAMTGQIRKVLNEDPGRVRSAQISQAGDGSDDQAVQAAAAGIQYRRPGQQVQEGADHRPRWPSATARANSIRKSHDGARRRRTGLPLFWPQSGGTKPTSWPLNQFRRARCRGSISRRRSWTIRRR